MSDTIQSTTVDPSPVKRYYTAAFRYRKGGEWHVCDELFATVRGAEDDVSKWRLDTAEVKIVVVDLPV